MSEKRDQLRSILLSTKDRKSEIVRLFNADVEIRQPTIREILDMNTEDTKEAIVNVLIKHCYVPGTDEHVFEEADREMILSWPVGTWLQNITEAVERLTNVNVGAAEKK